MKFNLQKLKEIWVKIKKYFNTTQFNCVFCYVKNLFKKRSDIKFDKKTLIIISSIVLIIAGLSIGMYSSQAKFFYLTEKIFDPLANTSFIVSISDSIYKAVWEKDFEMEKLKQEAELSSIKEERANKLAREEITKRNEAEVAKNEAEEKTKIETNKRNQAEAAKRTAQQKATEEENKRIQEELAREVAEQEIESKEAKEEKMNTDSDGDGLTYRQELDQGTLDTNIDSDGDGIKDNEDANPSGGDRLIAQHFEWDYQGTHWTWDYSFYSDWYDYYKNKEHGNHGIDYVTYNNSNIIEIADMLTEIANEEGYSKSQFAVAFIQSLGYVKDEIIDYDDYPKYPLETLAEQNGDCEDTSYLAAAIVKAMNISSVLVELPGHMAIAIAFSGSPDGYYYRLNNGWDYYYFETTEDGWGLGDMPSEYNSSYATLVEIPSGRTTYINPKYEIPCFSSSEFSGYYTDGENIYSDNQCSSLASCIFYEDFYVNPQTLSFYHDSGCTQIAVPGCYKSTNYPGYFYDDSDIYYSDSRCTQSAKICRSSTVYSDRYWDGNYNYWDSSCTQKVVSWCVKSTYYPGYFFNTIDSNIYYDYQCTQEADVY